MDDKLRNKRPTIGLITRSVWDGYGTPLWHGVMDAARALEVNLLTFPGSHLGRTDLARHENIIYELAGAETVDGLVISGGPLSQLIGVEALRDYCQRHWAPLPMVFTSIVPEGYAGVLVDNLSGMEAAVRHLIEVHG